MIVSYDTIIFLIHEQVSPKASIFIKIPTSNPLRVERGVP